MNIIGIGTDIVAIPRIKAIWDRFGWSFAKRILTLAELKDLEGLLADLKDLNDLKALKESNIPAPFLAKRFAAKEAFAKALGTGFRGILLTEIGINKDTLGKPQFIFTGQARAELDRRDVLNNYLSISDEKDYALAFVILVGRQKKYPSRGYWG